MTFHVVSAYGGHVADNIRYYIKDGRPTKDNTIVIFQKGPGLFHREGKQTIYALDGETVFATVTNAVSDNKWHTLRQASFSMHPLPLGTFPDPGSSFWKLFLHYIVAVWPHGKAAGGCFFNLEVDGPTNAYFP